MVVSEARLKELQAANPELIELQRAIMAPRLAAMQTSWAQLQYSLKAKKQSEHNLKIANDSLIADLKERIERLLAFRDTAVDTVEVLKQRVAELETELAAARKAQSPRSQPRPHRPMTGWELD